MFIDIHVYLQTLKGENRSWCIWYIVKISCLLASDDEEVLEQRSDPGNTITHSALYRIYTRIMVLGPPTIAVITLFCLLSINIWTSINQGLRNMIGCQFISCELWSISVGIYVYFRRVWLTCYIWLYLWIACRIFMFDIYFYAYTCIRHSGN